jgi:Na+/H+-dicarboxylate symporter
VTALLGRTTIGAFARAAAPAQLVALTTRSSIAALPALVQGGRDVLRLPETALSFVLPFCVALFKINRPLSGIARLLILAHVYGVPLTPATIAVYIATIMLMSFATAGVPATPFNALPAYLAAGIPIEGFIISEAVDVVPDMLKTWVNVTGDMSVATLLSRSERAVVPAAGVAVPAAESDVA